MNENETPQTSSTIQDQEALDVANGIQVSQPETVQPVSDLDFFNNAAERARENITVNYVPDEETVAVSHPSAPEATAAPVGAGPVGTLPPKEKSSLGERLIVGGVVGATVIGGIALGAGALNQFEQDQADNKRQNQEWAEEAEQARLIQEQELDSRKVSISVNTPSEQSENK